MGLFFLTLRHPIQGVPHPRAESLFSPEFLRVKYYSQPPPPPTPLELFFWGIALTSYLKASPS